MCFVLYEQNSYRAASSGRLPAKNNLPNLKLQKLSRYSVEVVHFKGSWAP